MERNALKFQSQNSEEKHTWWYILFLKKSARYCQKENEENMFICQLWIKNLQQFQVLEITNILRYSTTNDWDYYLLCQEVSRKKTNIWNKTHFIKTLLMHIGCVNFFTYTYTHIILVCINIICWMQHNCLFTLNRYLFTNT